MSNAIYLAMRVLRPRPTKAEKIPVNKVLEDRTEEILSEFDAFEHYFARRESWGLLADKRLMAISFRAYKVNASDLAPTAPPILRPRSS
ncbi:hypothetical protein N7516_005269 [Penicillium verrucosum]|uniref:uncharacterized protein n=1 Tax=Penicillium verrucosum TaxID=60171 RepID=UPI0025450C9A|nr:uncharacterized protein N7516_005269 [Penicillium verrucosum]KAJ5945101.1 hypothetical protein N7516_005269 [Penicillium verrucosum]